MLDLDRFTDALVAQTVKAIDAATARLIAENKVLSDRLSALERQMDAMPMPKDGKDSDPEAVAALVHDRIKGALDAMQDSVNGIQPAPELPDIPAMIEAAVAEAVKAIPDPQDGAPGVDGKSVGVEDVLPALQEQVVKFLETIPAPKDGRDGKDGKDGAQGERGEKGEQGPTGDRGEKGSDGIGLAGALIDRDGGLVVTLTNGEAKALGAVVGKDGAPGVDGKDGANGLGFEDLEFEISETGRAVAKFRRGDLVKTIALPGIVDRGTFADGEVYDKGDAVSWGGSLWIAQANGVKGKPEADKRWRLAVKRGRDGRDTEARKVL